MKQILLIDDDESDREHFEQVLAKSLGNVADVVVFEEDTGPESGHSFERHLSEYIPVRYDNLGLIACDKELGRYHNYRGLSSNVISSVAERLGVPFCQYSRQTNRDQEFHLFQRLMKWDSENITLFGTDAESWAPQTATLFNGFSALEDTIQAGESQKQRPAKLLAKILGHPEAESRIALYATGQQNIFSELMTFREKLTDRRLARILGTWLYLSLLRFPGLLLNEVAAASYLNISQDHFGNQKVRDFFKKAKYSGPFSDADDYWWREEIDGILADGSVMSGRELLKNNRHDVDECLDSQTGEVAGYYCIINNEPISRVNSVGGIAWIPAGADLARVRQDSFDEASSLLGLY